MLPQWKEPQREGGSVCKLGVGTGYKKRRQW